MEILTEMYDDESAKQATEAEVTEVHNIKSEEWMYEVGGAVLASPKSALAGCSPLDAPKVSSACSSADKSGEKRLRRGRSRTGSMVREDNSAMYLHITEKEEAMLRDPTVQVLSDSFIQRTHLQLGEKCDLPHSRASVLVPDGSVQHRYSPGTHKVSISQASRGSDSGSPSEFPHVLRAGLPAALSIINIGLGVGACVSESIEVVYAMVAVAVLQLLASVLVYQRKSVRVIPADDDMLLEMDSHLLYTIIPEDVVSLIHQGSRCIATQHESLTFSFTDLVGFTKMTAGMLHTELVLGLNTLFTIFDELADELKVTKVKTIGDCYMAVTGFRQAGLDHIKNMVDWCIRVQMQVTRLSLPELHLEGIQVRSGIATGSAVSGVLGRIKPIYDFWGDTVNMASRMESLSRPNRINCTEVVATHLREKYAMEFEVVPGQFVKGKGRMDTYLLVLNGFRPKQPQTFLTEAPQSATLDKLEEMQSKEAFGKNMKEMLETINELAAAMELEKAVQLVVRTVERLIRCDRASLFLIDKENHQLWSYHKVQGKQIRMPIGVGVAGWVAMRGEPLILHNAYDDERFNSDVDRNTGYTTRNILCCPVKRGDQGEVIAVVQAINKTHGSFDMHDAALLSLLGNQAGVHLMSGQLLDTLRQSEQRMGDLAQICATLLACTSLEEVFRCTSQARDFFKCRDANLYVLVSGSDKDRLLRLSESGKLASVSLNTVAGKAAQTLELQNVKDLSADSAVLSESLNEQCNALCCPIIAERRVLGVIELQNRILPGSLCNGEVSQAIFTNEDEAVLRVYCAFVASVMQSNSFRADAQVAWKLSKLVVAIFNAVHANGADWEDIVFTAVEQRLPDILGCGQAALWFVEGNTLRCGKKTHPLEGITGRVATDKTPYVSGSIQPFAEADFSEHVDQLADTVDTLLMHPIMGESRIIGVLQAANKSGCCDFQYSDTRTASLICESISAMLTSLHHETQTGRC